MKAMVLHEAKTPLRLEDVERPEPSSTEVLVKVEACGVCRTDLHVVDGELPEPKLPLILGHQIVGTVISRGDEGGDFERGERVGIPWMGWTCGQCKYCRSGRENLCDHARFTGYTLDGGYAEFAVADHRFCIRIPEQFEPVAAAPLLCAGLIGFRTYRKAGDAKRLGFYGFGAAAHIVAQIALYEGREIYAFTRPGDRKAQEFAKSMGAIWAGDSDKPSPEELDAALIFAPVGAVVPAALRAVSKGGAVVCGGIHMSDIPSFPYSILWGERLIESVANLTRKDGTDFMKIAPKVPVHAHTETFTLEEANVALDRFRSGNISGAAVLIPS